MERKVPGPLLLEVRGVSLSFGGVHALREVDFHVHEGEVCAIIGPNGAGKSSLLNVINGVYAPGAGTISYAGETRRAMRPHRAAEQGIARTFQNIALFKGMSVLDNVMTGRALKMRRGLLWQALYSSQAAVHVETQVRFEDGRTGMVQADLPILEATIVEDEAARRAA